MYPRPPPYRAACSAPTAFGAPPTSLCGPSSSAGCKPRRLQTTSRMSSQPEDGWHGGSGSGDGQAPPAGNAASDAAFPNPMEPSQGTEGVPPAMAPGQTPGAMRDGPASTPACCSPQPLLLEICYGAHGCPLAPIRSTTRRAASRWLAVRLTAGSRQHGLYTHTRTGRKTPERSPSQKPRSSSFETAALKPLQRAIIIITQYHVS